MLNVQAVCGVGVGVESARAGPPVAPTATQATIAAAARELGVQNFDVVEVKLGERSIRGPIYTQPGLADYSLGLALGYGRTKVGRVGIGTGFNAYPLFTTKTGYIATGATLRKTGTHASLVEAGGLYASLAALQFGQG